MTHFFGSLLELVARQLVALRVRHQHLDHARCTELGRKVQRRLVHSLVWRVEVEVEQYAAALECVACLAVHVTHKRLSVDGLQYVRTDAPVPCLGSYVQCVIA